MAKTNKRKTNDENNANLLENNFLNKKYWRKGIMTSGIQALIDYSFTTLNLNRLEAQVFEFHTASIALFRKLKFTEEGILRKNFLIEGKFENSIMFSMLNVGNL